jgi:VanZ family protein
MLTVTVLWVIFIYCNSLLNADISSSQSGFVLNLIQNAAAFIGISPDLLTEYIIRKVAHFCEYALYGFLLCVTVKLWCGGFKNRIFMILFLGLIVPVTDEFLQVFVDGRVGAVPDVVLDFCGFVAAAAFYAVLKRRPMRFNKKRVS